MDFQDCRSQLGTHLSEQTRYNLNQNEWDVVIAEPPREESRADVKATADAVPAGVTV